MVSHAARSTGADGGDDEGARDGGARCVWQRSKSACRRNQSTPATGSNRPTILAARPTTRRPPDRTGSGTPRVQRRIESDGDATFISNGSYKMKVTSTVTMNGQARTTTRVMDGTFISADCGDIKPVTPATLGAGGRGLIASRGRRSPRLDKLDGVTRQRSTARRQHHRPVRDMAAGVKARDQPPPTCRELRPASFLFMRGDASEHTRLPRTQGFPSWKRPRLNNTTSKTVSGYLDHSEIGVQIRVRNSKTALPGEIARFRRPRACQFCEIE